MKDKLSSSSSSWVSSWSSNSWPGSCSSSSSYPLLLHLLLIFLLAVPSWSSLLCIVVFFFFFIIFSRNACQRFHNWLIMVKTFGCPIASIQASIIFVTCLVDQDQLYKIPSLLKIHRIKNSHFEVEFKIYFSSNPLVYFYLFQGFTLKILWIM